MIDLPQRSVLRARDQLEQACRALLERPGRSSASLLLVAVGAALIVTVVALGDTAQAQVSARFDALRATTVEVGLAGGAAEDLAPAAGAAIFPADANDRLGELRNVEAVGAVIIRAQEAEVASSPIALPGQPALVGERFIWSDPGLERAARLEVQGRWISGADVKQQRPVVVIGSVQAERMGISRPLGELLVDGRSYSLIGIIRSSPIRPELLDSVVIARETEDGESTSGVSIDSAILMQVRPGAAQQVAEQAPLQLFPEAPGRFKASAAQDPDDFRQALETDTATVMSALAVVGIFVGTLATLLVWWSSVEARRGTIGLWLALGATRMHVFRLIISECLVGGLVAGLVGAAAGAVAVSLVCVAQQWQLVMSPWLIPSAVLGTTVVGGIAGCLPAVRAAAVDPVDSLRS